jgi:hypothetical protein
MLVGARSRCWCVSDHVTTVTVLKRQHDGIFLCFHIGSQSGGCLSHRAKWRTVGRGFMEGKCLCVDVPSVCVSESVKVWQKCQKSQVHHLYWFMVRQRKFISVLYCSRDLVWWWLSRNMTCISQNVATVRIPRTQKVVRLLLQVVWPGLTWSTGAGRA